MVLLRHELGNCKAHADAIAVGHFKGRTEALHRGGLIAEGAQGLAG